MTTTPFQSFLDDLQTLINRHRPVADLEAHGHDVLARAQVIARAHEPGLRKTFATITEYVANDREIEPGLLDQSIRKCREQRICEIRWICFLFCREFTHSVYAVIADHFHCDHGSVLHGITRLADFCSLYPETKQLIDRLRTELSTILTVAASKNSLVAFESFKNGDRPAAALSASPREKVA